MITVSKATTEVLENIREQLNFGSVDEVIRFLIKEHRKVFLNETFGADRRKIKRFSEEDRGEDR